MNNYEKTGLVKCGKDDDGEQMYIGTVEQFEAVEEDKMNEEEELWLGITQSKIDLIDHCLGYCKHRLERHPLKTNGLSRKTLDPIINLRKELKK